MDLNIQKLLTKKITRKQFLVFLGMLGITIFGIPSLLKTISGLDINNDKKQVKRNVGQSSFGSGAYGI